MPFLQHYSPQNFLHLGLDFLFADYLKDFANYPIAVALASVPPGDPTVLLTACVLVTLPPLFLFAFFNRELTEGIALGGEK